MRATLATAVLVAAWLMAALALTSAQNSAGDQEKPAGAAGQKISPARAIMTMHRLLQTLAFDQDGIERLSVAYGGARCTLEAATRSER
jgi:hypothetical protein